MHVMLSAMPRQRPFEKRERSVGGGRRTTGLVEAVETPDLDIDLEIFCTVSKSF